MAPTADEELKLRLYCGEISQLGPSERFLKSLVEIPFAFKRMEALLLMSSLPEDVSAIKESFATLEVNCVENFLLFCCRHNLYVVSCIQLYHTPSHKF